MKRTINKAIEKGKCFLQKDQKIFTKDGKTYLPAESAISFVIYRRKVKEPDKL